MHWLLPPYSVHKCLHFWQEKKLKALEGSVYKNFFSKYFQIQRKLRIWSHWLKKSLMENFIFSTVKAKIRILLAYFLNILSFFRLEAYLEPCHQTFVISLLCPNIAVNYFQQKHCVKSVRILSYSVWMRENADQNNSEYGHFSRSEISITAVWQDPKYGSFNSFMTQVLKIQKPVHWFAR